MVVQTRKANQPLKLLPFSLGIAIDVALIALIVLVPQAAPLVPIAGIVQSLVRRPTKNDLRWEEAAKKIQEVKLPGNLRLWFKGLDTANCWIPIGECPSPTDLPANALYRATHVTLKR